MREEEIGRTVGTAPEPATGLAQMIDLVSDRGGYDNATGVLIFVDAV
jgi:serine/threonine protein phosphatase PrpC